MADESNMQVFLILVPLFLAVGIYLLWYSRRRRRMLETFANAHGFHIDRDRAPELAAKLDHCFSLGGRGLVRGFEQLTSPIAAGAAWLFRAVEILDLSPHGQSQSTHFTRIIALFDVVEAHEDFFILDRTGAATARLPGAPAPSPRVVEVTRRAFSEQGARHPLSITLARGKGLIYFEPFVTGGENTSDLEALYNIAVSLQDALSQPKGTHRAAS
jgi:hypothetical protein